MPPNYSEEVEEVFQSLNNPEILGNPFIVNFEIGGVEARLTNNNPIGDLLENWFGAWLEEEGIHYSEGESQLPPDYYLSPEPDPESLLEVKVFNQEAGPGFDVADFNAYWKNLRNDSFRLDADYIIFEYIMNEEGQVRIEDIYLKKVWEICGPSNSWPIKVQCKNDFIKNIRPVSFNNSNAHYTPFSSKSDFVRAIYNTLLEYDKLDDEEYEDWLNEVAEDYLAQTGEDLR